MEYLLPVVERGIIITCLSTMVRCGADCAAGAQGFFEAAGNSRRTIAACDTKHWPGYERRLRVRNSGKRPRREGTGNRDRLRSVTGRAKTW